MPESQENPRLYNILAKFKDYTEGTRVMFLMSRRKDENGDKRSEKIRKIITTSHDEFSNALNLFLNAQDKAFSFGMNLRIYSSVNARNMNKAIREFKQRQLDRDFDSIQIRNQFYCLVKDQFISCMMKQHCKETSFFLLDVDQEDATEIFIHIENLNEAGKNIKILGSFPTKNGWHVITTPFDPKYVDGIKNVSVQKDGLLLLSY